jgi:hypothetical protein
VICSLRLSYFVGLELSLFYFSHARLLFACFYAEAV